MNKRILGTMGSNPTLKYKHIDETPVGRQKEGN